MRISTQALFMGNQSRIQEAQARYVRAQQQVATGMRFERASEDPVAAQAVISARGLKNRIERLEQNLRHADEYVGLTETTMGEISDMMKRAYVLSLQGASDTSDQNARDAMATEIDEIQRRLVDLGNAKTSTGGYLFAGQSLATRPFSVTAGALQFAGDDDPVQVEVRPGEAMRVNMTGAANLFGTAFSALESLKSNLRAGNSQLIGDTDVAALQGAQRRFDQTRGEFGVKAQSVSAQRSQNARRIDDLTARIGEAQEVDLAEAVTQMRLSETAYSAALQVAAQGYRLSLMDFLR